MVERIGNQSDGKRRATVLSIDSQITSLMIVILAPLVGYISDTFGIDVMLISLGLFMIIVEIIYLNKKSA